MPFLRSLLQRLQLPRPYRNCCGLWPPYSKNLKPGFLFPSELDTNFVHVGSVAELRITRGPVSATVLLGDSHDLRCDTTLSPAAGRDVITSDVTNNVTSSQPVTSPALTSSAAVPPLYVVIWQKDGVTLRRSGEYYRVRRRTGRLHFAQVQISIKQRKQLLLGIS